MPRDSNGTYTAPTNSWNPPVGGTTIDASDWIAQLADYQTAWTDSLSRTGQGGMLADLELDDNAILAEEIATPSNPSANRLKVYAVDDGGTTKLATLDSAGTQTVLGSGGGGGSPAGLSTEVQYNNAGNFGASANFTFSSPALTIGVAGSTTGQLKLTGSTSGTITIAGQAGAGTYNFNLPTAAGTAGQPLLSGGGVANPMTFGTLGLAGGGTGSALADPGADRIMFWDDSDGVVTWLAPTGALVITTTSISVNNMVGDSGAGGTAGLVPAPASGDAAANKFLKADGTWTAPSGSGDVVGPASSTDLAVARFDGMTGKLLQDGPVTIADTTGLISGSRFANAGLRLEDTNASHLLTSSPGSNITADRTLTLTTGDSSRTLTFTADASIGSRIGYGGGSITSNIAVGDMSLVANTTGANNTAVGVSSLAGNTIGTNNTGVGHNALAACTTGAFNTAIGSLALDSNVTGSDNTAIGVNTLTAATGSRNVGIGNYTLQSCVTGIENTAVGYDVMFAMVSGVENTAVGMRAMEDSTGNRNTVVGAYAMIDGTGDDNTMVGRNAGNALTTGGENTAVGRNALSACTTGIRNVCIGTYAGDSLTTGTNNVVIGYDADAAAAGSTNSVTLGNSSVTIIRAQVTTITAFSDARDKTDISDLPLGLDFIKALRPRTYRWDQREFYEDGIPDGTHSEPHIKVGFIAQEIRDVALAHGAGNLGFFNEDCDGTTTRFSKLAIEEGRILPVAVKAIQELAARIEALEAR
jgi:hypothetical protein